MHPVAASQSKLCEAWLKVLNQVVRELGQGERTVRKAFQRYN
jgi:DNA-binding transcriptional regulator PaaX